MKKNISRDEENNNLPILRRLLAQDKAKNADDAAHRQVFLTQYWGKRQSKMGRLLFSSFLTLFFLLSSCSICEGQANPTQEVEVVRLNQFILHAQYDSLKNLSLSMLSDPSRPTRQKWGGFGMGKWYFFTGRIDSSLFFLRQALEPSIALPVALHSEILTGMGNVFHQMGNLDSTLIYLKRNLALQDALNKPKSKAKILGNLGNAYGERGEFIPAIAYLEQALALGDTITKASCHLNMGYIFRLLGMYEESTMHNQQCLELAQKSAYPPLIVDAYSAMITVAPTTEEAIKWQEKGFALADSLRLTPSRLRILLSTGIRLGELGALQLGTKYLEKSLMFARQDKQDIFVYYILNALASFYSHCKVVMKKMCVFSGNPKTVENLV